MNSFWSPAIRELSPYVPGEQPAIENLVKLNTNENPYGPSPAALAACRDAAADSLRLYPDPDALKLKQALADHHGCARDQVFVGNGSDEVLAHAFHAFFRQDLPILTPAVGYSFYPVYCRLYGIEYSAVPMADGMRIDPHDYRGACGGVVLANPNAPTGIALSLGEVEQILLAQPERVVLVDEAYVDFGAESAVTLVARHPNLLVVQTFSKSRALAGLRVGAAFGQAHLIAGLERVKNSFNSYPLGRIAIAGAVASLGDREWFETMRARVIANRERLAGQLAELGFTVLPSAANFLFASHARHDAAALAQALRQRAILVRHFNAPAIAQFLRISIGTEEECGRLAAALADLVGAGA